MADVFFIISVIMQTFMQCIKWLLYRVVQNSEYISRLTFNA